MWSIATLPKMPSATRMARSRGCPTRPPGRGGLGWGIVLLVSVGCVPYTSGLTARPVPEGTVQRSVTISGLSPTAFLRDSVSIPVPWPDVAVRWPLDSRTDIGVRLPSAVILSVRRQVIGEGIQGVAAGVEGAVGVTFEGKPHAGTTVTVSGSEAGRVTPYGGVRALVSGTGNTALRPFLGGTRETRTMQAVGAFLGLRMGGMERGVAPEIGVFVVRPGFAPFERRVVLVPGLTIYGPRWR